MTPGQVVRKLLGPAAFKPIGDAYRALFVDLEAVSACFPELPQRAHILEVGGGEGQLLNAVLSRFGDARATMLDINPQLGGGLEPSLLTRVELLPGESIAQYAERGRPPPDLISVCDVVHHVPEAQRTRFFADLRPLMGPETKLLVKDVRPGSPRAYLALMADRYVSGDRGVDFIDEDAMEALVKGAIPRLKAKRTSLIEHDAPNYALVFSR